MRSLPAIYNQRRFASRLEARWACFWDLVGIRWVYEPAAIDLDSLVYIPDFYLPDWDAWVEIKGEMVSDEEGLRIIEKCRQLAAQSAQLTILCFDEPFDPRCAVFYKHAMHAPCHWRMCRYCGEIGIEVPDRGVRCPNEHGAPPLDIQSQRLRSRFIYDAACQARQARFAWPKRKRPAGQGKPTHAG